MKTRDLARLIIRTAEIREESFDSKMALHLSRQYKKEILYPDYNRCYRIDLPQAAELAVKELNLDARLAELVYYALYNSWNDMLAWAERIVK